MKKVNCLNCGHIFEPESFGCDKLVEDIAFFAVCPQCESSFDIDEDEAMAVLIPDGTKVKYFGDEIGVIDGCDLHGYDDVDESMLYDGSDAVFDNINYYVCPIQFTTEEFWSDHYVMLRREEFEIVKG